MAKKGKTDAISFMRNETGASAAYVNEAYNAFVKFMQVELKKGNTIYIPNIGTLEPVTRAARNGINPRTKEEIRIPSQKTVKFKPAAKLKRSLN